MKSYPFVSANYCSIKPGPSLANEAVNTAEREKTLQQLSDPHLISLFNAF